MPKAFVVEIPMKGPDTFTLITTDASFALDVKSLFPDTPRIRYADHCDSVHDLPPDVRRVYEERVRHWLDQQSRSGPPAEQVRFP